MEDLNKNSLRKNYLYLLFFKFFVAVVKFLIGVITARFLGPEAKGIFVAITRLPGLLATIGTLSIGESLIYYKGKGVIKTEWIFLITIVSIFVISTVLNSIIFFVEPFILNSLFSEIDHSYFKYIYYIVPLLVTNYFSSKSFQSLENFKAYNVISVLNYMMLLILLLIGLSFIGSNVETALTIFTVSFCISMTFALLVLFNQKRKLVLPKRDVYKKLITYGSTVHIGEVLIQVEYQLDIYIILFYLSPTEVGIYSVAVTLAQFLWYLTNSLNTVLFPRITNINSKDKVIDLVLRSIRHMLFICFIVGVFLVLIGNWFIALSFGDDFLEAYYVFLIMLPAIWVDIIFRVLFTWFKSENLVNSIAITSAVSLVCNVILNIILIPQYGIYGSAIASLLTYSLRVVIVLAMFLFKSKSPLLDVLVIKHSEILGLILALKQFTKRVF